jgi:hypothetical protein
MAISKEGLVLLTATSFVSPLSKYTKITAGGSLLTSNQFTPSTAITAKVSDISHNGNTVTMGQDSYSQVTTQSATSQTSLSIHSFTHMYKQKYSNPGIHISYSALIMAFTHL